MPRPIFSVNEPFDRVAFPFPLDARRECTLWLPRKGLTPDEAERLKAYIDSLTIPLSTERS